MSNEKQFNNADNNNRLERLFRQNCDRPWEHAIEPIRLSPHVFYVGGKWVGATLIDTGDGLILIDCGLPAQLYLIFEGIRKLGFDPQNIKKLLISHAHFDHAGAAKAVLEYTGAKLYAAKEDLAALEGKDIAALRTRGEAYTGVTPNEFYADDKPIIQGNVVIKTMLTAGHTPGTTSFFFEDKDEDGNVYKLGLHGGLGLNTLTAKDEDDIPRVKAVRKLYRSNVELLKTFPIDVTCSNHPGMAHLCERSTNAESGSKAMCDPNVWGEMLDRYLAMLDSLEAEQQ